jgi:hypothetical protein
MKKYLGKDTEDNKMKPVAGSHFENVRFVIMLTAMVYRLTG